MTLHLPHRELPALDPTTPGTAVPAGGPAPRGDRRAGVAPAPRGRIGRVVAVSLAVGPVAAALLVVAPFVPPTEAGATAAVLCGLALGWATLAVLSTRSTDQPQSWAAVPAVLMGLSGLLLLVLGSPVLEPLSRLWPPVMLAVAVWALVRARRALDGAAGRRLLSVVLAVLALASIGGGYQTVRTTVDAAGGAPGQLVDVGGHRLHLDCTGSGSPTVVVEPGAGMVAAQVGLVAPAVARDTRVCVYDRAGRGWSEPARTRQDATQIATDLHTLLERGGEAGPYVLAGHSFGGLYAMTFAARYPADVAGMVLVDTTPPAPADGPVAPARGDAGSSDLADRVSALVSISARLGLGHLVDQPTPSSLRSALHEYVQGGASAEQAASLRDLADTPLVVLTAGVGQDPEDAAAHRELATLSSATAHRVVEGVDHGGMITDPDGAAATARAVLDVVSAVRTAQPQAE